MFRAVEERVSRIAASRDASAALAPDALEDARRLGAVLDAGDPATMLRGLHLLGLLFWYRYLASRDDGELRSAVAAFTPCFVAGATTLPAPVVPLVVDEAAGTAAEQGHLLDSGDPVLVRDVVRLWHRLVAETPADSPYFEGRLSHYQAGLARWFALAGKAANASTAVARTAEGIGLLRETIAAVPEGVPGRCGCLIALGAALLQRATLSEDLADVDAAVAATREAAAVTPPEHPDFELSLSNLCGALTQSYRRTRNTAHLEEGIAAGRGAVAASPAAGAERGRALTNLSGLLDARDRLTGDPAAREEVLALSREAARVIPAGHPDRAPALNNLGLSLRRSYERTRHSAALDEAVDVAREALLAAADVPWLRRVARANLVDTLRTRLNEHGEAADLEELIPLEREIVTLLPAAHADRRVRVAGLAGALLDRARRAGPDAPPEPARTDLDDAIAYGREAADLTPDDHADHGAVLANLGLALRLRFDRTGSLADLEEAIPLGRVAAERLPRDHPGAFQHRLRLVESLRERAVRAGAVSDLDEAIASGREMVEAARHDDGSSAPPAAGEPATGEPAEAGRAARDRLLALLSEVGDCMRIRHELTLSRADLNEAVAMSREAVALTPEDGANRAAVLVRLSVALLRRSRWGSLADLDESLAIARAVLDLPAPRPPGHAYHRSNLGAILWARYEMTRDGADLDRAVSALRDACAAVPAEDDRVSSPLSNLAVALRIRFERTGRTGDLDEAVTVGRRAVRAAGADRPERALIQYALGLALSLRYGRFHDQADRAEAVRMCATAADITSAPVRTRIAAARSAARLAADHDTARAAELLAAAVGLMPAAVALRLERGDRQNLLGELAGLAAEAAALALADRDDAACEGAEQRAIRALRLLEQGRGVLLGQALDLRGDLTDLEARHPGLARRFRAVSARLDTSPDPGPSTLPLMPGGSHLAPLLREALQTRNAERVDAAGEFEDVLAEIRALPGLAGFLLPPERDELTGQAEQGPLVVLNVSRFRSDAVLVTPEGITSLELPSLTPESVAARVDSLYPALSTAHDPDAPAVERVRAQSEIHRTLEWLWDEAAGPVLDALGFGAPPAEGEPLPRVWWIPVGLLGLLPLHAAGHHREPAGTGALSGPRARSRRTVMDRVVSSYAPTVRALGHARTRAARAPASDRGLIAAMPVTPAAGPLPYAAAEAELVARRLPDAVLLIGEEDAPPPRTRSDHPEGAPTKRRVLEALPGCAIAHFACHGHSDPVDPSRSRLLLRDHRTDPLAVSDIAAVRLDHARLAYLAACRTAFHSAADLADEAVHLASAFQLAGYPHVIGTLWETDDRLSAQLADAFYAEATAEDGHLDAARSARAIHAAVRALRDRLPVTPSLWAAHIHAGA